MGTVTGVVVRLALVGIVVGALTGCVLARRGPPTIQVDRASALADEAVHVRILGLDPGAQVAVGAGASDYAGVAWRSESTFVADAEGMVDLDRDAPVDGSYRGVDGMGLFWSMDPTDGTDPDQAFFVPTFPEAAAAYDVVLTARSGTASLPPVVVRREWMAPGVTHAHLDLTADKVVGELYRPPATTLARPGVLLLGGSEGGASSRFQAALLASHGYTALALGYFALPGLPPTLEDIPIEYFATAAATLPGPVRVLGYSRGTEAALLVSALYPELVHGTVVYAPADRVWAAFPSLRNAWTLAGKPQTSIPFQQIVGPVLAIAGTEDLLWPSGAAAGVVERATGGRSLLYPGAGHGVGSPPYVPAGTTLRHPVTGQVLPLGGSRPANQAAQRQSWAKLLDLLAQT